MNKTPLFLTNDETQKNSYGFYVKTAGIDLKSRFLSNPVCLNNHSNDTKDVLGKWTDIKVEGGKLMMRPNFDTEDANGKEVVRKVLSGTIKGCSLGIMFDPADMVMDADNKIVLEKCVLFEVSIVAVPSNGNAIALFSMNGEEITEKEIKTICLDLQTAKPFKKPITMKQVTTHLQLADDATEVTILEAIKGIEAQLTASKNELLKFKKLTEDLQAEKAAKLQADYDAVKAVALKDGRIDADALGAIEELAVEKRIELLNKLPKRKTVKSALEAGENSNENIYEKLSFAELRKKGMLAQLKADNPELYKEKFREEFGKEPSN